VHGGAAKRRSAQLRPPVCLVAPNAFRGGPDSGAVARAIARGVETALGSATALELPMADGGDGTLEIVLPRFGGTVSTVRVAGPRGKATEARLGFGERTAVIEMADASGSRLLAAGERDAFRSSSVGTGQLIRHAVEAGARRVIVGAGGSATIDAGAGALHVLGAKFLDSAGNELDPTPAELATVERVATDGLERRLKDVSVVVLGDVAAPLRENARLFGTQKGLRPEDAPALASTLARLGRAYARVAGSDLQLLDRPYFGAGGGLAGGLAMVAGARVYPGSLWIGALVRLAAACRRASCVITAEGRFDESSHAGKAPGLVLRAAAHRGRRSVIIAGEVSTCGLAGLPACSGVRELGTSAATEPGVTLQRLEREAAIWASELRLT
jgi:glycerate kinase